MKKQVLQTNAFEKSKHLLERQERRERLDGHVAEADFDANDF
jgi:hypothetical protein